MKKHANLTLLSCAAVLLLSGPALANHCSADLTKVQQRLSQPTSASANALRRSKSANSFFTSPRMRTKP